MTAMLTSREVQDLVKVDRSTIYRMAETGELPAVRVGRQWRFPADEIEAWLASRSNRIPSPPPPPRASAPSSALREIVELLADTLGVTILVTDLAGTPVTPVANPCGLFDAVIDRPGVLDRCIADWRGLGEGPGLGPRFSPSHLGLLCARAFVRVEDRLVGMVIAGGIAPEEWPPADEQVAAIAAEVGVDPSQLVPHLAEVFAADEFRRRELLEILPRLAHAISHLMRDPGTGNGAAPAYQRSNE